MARKYNRVVLALGRLVVPEVIRYCLSIRFFPVDIVQAIKDIDKHFRDLDRAIQTFSIVADVEGGGWAVDFVGTCIKPFVFYENKEYCTNIFFSLAVGVTEDAAMIHIKPALSAASALLRHANYRVAVKVRPTVQLELPYTESEEKSNGIDVDASEDTGPVDINKEFVKESNVF